MEEFLIQYLTSKPNDVPSIYAALIVLGILWLWGKLGLSARLLKIKGKLPDWVQPIPPIVLSFAVVGIRAYLSGVRGEVLWYECWKEAFGTSAVAVTLWHDGVKRWLPVLLKLLTRGRGTVSCLLAILAWGFLVMSWSGCSVSLEGSRAQGAADRRAGVSPVAPSTRCASLDAQHRWGGATAAGAALLAGGSGLAGIEVDPDQRELRQGLAVAAVGMAALAAGAEWYAMDAAGDWARECSP
jgi:hypothetical protein